MTTHTSTATLIYVVSAPWAPVSPLARVAELPIAERVCRAAGHAGYRRIVAWDPQGCLAGLAEGGRRAPRGTSVVPIASREAWRRQIAALSPAATLTVVGPATIVSSSLLRDAASLTPGGGERVCDVPAGPAWPESGVLRMRAADAADLRFVLAELQQRGLAPMPLPSGDDVTRGRGRLVVRIQSEHDLPLATAVMKRAVFKSTDATLARFNRRLSLPISLRLLRTPVTANQISVALVILGFVAAWLFSRGAYLAGVAAGAISLAASILDGCDGEVARLKYQESALGCWIETFGDYSYYLAIFLGLTVGSVRHTGWPGFYWIGGVGIAGTILSFLLLIFLRSRITAGQPETLHAIARARFQADASWWSRLTWRLAFVATRSAMPYGIAALAVLNLLPLVVVLLAIGGNVYWLTLVLKLRHLLAGGQAETVTA